MLLIDKVLCSYCFGNIIFERSISFKIASIWFKTINLTSYYIGFFKVLLRWFSFPVLPRKISSSAQLRIREAVSFVS